MQFQRVTPESVGIPSAAIRDFLKKVRAANIEMHGFMLLRHGRVCAEGWWDPYTPDTKHILFSLSKTLTATAIGFAEQEGILSLEDKLVDIFPDLIPEAPGENLKKADIYSLLTMSCGHEVELSRELSNTVDWVKNFLHHEFKYEPGTMFQYNTAGTNMLSAILLRKTGLSLTQFLKPRLFDKLGLENIVCQMLPDGVERGGSGFFLSTEDVARVAQFYLQRGVWAGERLLNEGWFDRATVKQIETANPIYVTDADNWRAGYSFQMWQCVPKGVYRMDGAWGQFGIVMPDKDAVLAIHSTSTNTNDLLNIAWETLLDNMSDDALPENPMDAHVLAAELKTLCIPTEWGVRCFSAEKQFGGVKYAAQENMPSLIDLIAGAGHREPIGGRIRALSLAFEKTEAVLTVEEDDDIKQLRIGLTGERVKQELGGRVYAASGGWHGADHFDVEVRCVQYASGAHLRLRFAEDALSVEKTSTLPVDRAENLQFLLEKQG